MDVESRDLFIKHTTLAPAKATTKRFISLVRATTAGNDRWDIVLDGENTFISFSENVVKSIKISGRYDMVDDIIEGLIEDLKDYGGFTLTLDERIDLTKLFFSLL